MRTPRVTALCASHITPGVQSGVQLMSKYCPISFTNPSLLQDLEVGSRSASMAVCVLWISEMAYRKVIGAWSDHNIDSIVVSLMACKYLGDPKIVDT